MAEPITPKFMADTVLCQRLSIDYNQTWDGVSWVITPAEVTVIGLGDLAETGTEVLPADITLLASDLPPAGVSALQDLLNYIEQEMATKYA